MQFMLDENVPASVATTLGQLGHQATFIRDYVPPGSPDAVVATVAEEMNAVLVSFDGDFQKISPRIPIGHRTRFRRLSRIWMRCGEPQASNRIEAAIELFESEIELAKNREADRLTFWIGTSYLRTER